MISLYSTKNGLSGFCRCWFEFSVFTFLEFVEIMTSDGGKVTIQLWEKYVLVEFSLILVFQTFHFNLLTAVQNHSALNKVTTFVHFSS